MEAGGRDDPVWRRWSAERTVTRRQAAVAGALGIAWLGLLALRPVAALALVAALFTGVFVVTTGYRVVYFVRGLERAAARGRAPGPAIGSSLPRYSVMVALYREAAVVPALLDAIDAIDYPFDRLEVLLLLEHDDAETLAACRRRLRPGWRIVTVPPGEPRTKPRALNAGLEHVTGELFTIYDAEDRPEPDQLRKAVAEFRRLPREVASLQARLDFYNADQNLLTRWFTCDYGTHFGLYLEGIADYGHPMPLGGTSTHFRTAVVREVGGWDAWNVTEDCELGIRLAAAGYRSRTLDSTTWEEAVPHLRTWIRQRSRWIKGFAQTGLVLLREPLRCARALGAGRYAAALASTAGVPVVLLAQIVFWLLLWVYVAARALGADVSAIEAAFPGPLLALGMLSLLGGNFVVILAHVSAVYQQGRYELVRYALTSPAYWLLASIAGWKGVSQLVWKPHFWEKTTHGLAGHEAVPAAEPLAVARARRFRRQAGAARAAGAEHEIEAVNR